ncbi:MAG: ribonuclease H-like domain-containing protein [Candidatus Moranbacteria bacterium]|nr:ribonuclease H-like domain-containing protein [Candidatus Moranbacteria bacterium]
MRKIVFDVETQNTFRDIGKNDPSLLDISLLVVYDYTTEKYTSYMEKDFSALWKVLEEIDLVIGYNSDHFDIPVLNKYYPGDLSTIGSLDLLKEVQASLGRRLRLDVIAEGTLGINKSGHGLDAIKWWKSGEIEKIRKYCEDDVRITKEIYDYALQNKSLKYKELGKVHEFPLDVSRWEQRSVKKPAMNLTLGI